MKPFALIQCLVATGLLSSSGAAQTPSFQQASATAPARSVSPFPEKKAAVDLAVKAAGIEVAWLSDPVTYPFRLRAEQALGEETIVITGYVPNEALRQKAASVAQNASVGITLLDMLSVQPNMALPMETATQPEQLTLVRELIEKAVPGLGKQLQLAIDAHGVTTVSGRIDEFPQRRKVIRALQGIPGCTAIKYDLRVATPRIIATVSETKEVVTLPPVPDKSMADASAKKNVPAKETAAAPQQPVRQASLQASSTSTPVIQLEPAQSASAARLLIPSTSGLTPPVPPVTLGQPVTSRSIQSSFLTGLPVMPKSNDVTEPMPTKPPELIKALAESALPPKPVAPPLPIIQFSSTVEDIQQTGKVEKIDAKPK